jgi:hypothetical protein
VEETERGEGEDEAKDEHGVEQRRREAIWPAGGSGCEGGSVGGGTNYAGGAGLDREHRQVVEKIVARPVPLARN